MAAPHPALLQLVRGRPFPSDFRVTMQVANSAVEHGMAPLLDEAIRDGDLAGDHDALVTLAMRSLDSAAETEAAITALSVVAEACESLGIEIAVIKGLAIGTRWYPRAELRPATDVDIVIAPGQQDRLHELIGLFDRGLGETIAEAIEPSQGFDHAVLVAGVAVDVHTDPTKLLVIPRQRELAWEHTAWIEHSDGRSVRAFDLELSLVYALINLVRDNFADLLHIYDVSLMLDQKPNWEVIEAFAADEGWTDLIRYSLGVVCRFLDRSPPLPEGPGLLAKTVANVVWPERILLKGTDSAARSLRRQALVALLISGRRRELPASAFRRIFRPRRLIDHHSRDASGPYLLALYRWRRAQRARVDRLGAHLPTADTSDRGVTRRRARSAPGPDHETR